MCRASRVGHFIFVSTCSNYGLAASERLMTEDDELAPLSLYAETKVAVEQALTERNGLPYTCLRLATVYGAAPRMRLDLTVNQFAVEAWRDRRLEIYGEGFWRPYVHVEDVARAIVLALATPDRSLGRTFNVGHTDENYTKHMLYELLCERLPDLEAEWVSVSDDPRSYRVSFARIADELGFVPRRRVPDGLDQVLLLAALGAYMDADAPRFRN
jgi:nucleoside-diphosphate-sugar epimerase